MEIKHTTTTPSHFEGGCQCIEIIVSYSITFWYNLIALRKNIYLQHKNYVQQPILKELPNTYHMS